MAKPYRVKYFNNVQCKNVEWLWYPYIPYGKITIIQGDPGDGKSTFALNLASIVSNGYEIPFTGMKIKACPVVYQNCEDGTEDTICPRLIACGANLDKIAYIEEYDSSLTMDDERLEKVVEETGARLLILDPIQAYFGSNTDMNRAGDIRPIMNKLAQMAERTNCAVVLVGHMSKGKNGNVLYRSLGSIDIPAAARSVLLLSKLEGEPDCRIVTQIKSNLAPIGNSFVFRLEKNSKVTWLHKSRLSIEEILENCGQSPKRKKYRAIVILQEMLKDGECLSTKIFTECLKQGISERTLITVKSLVGVKSVKKKDGWYWYLEDNKEWN